MLGFDMEIYPLPNEGRTSMDRSAAEVLETVFAVHYPADSHGSLPWHPKGDLANHRLFTLDSSVDERAWGRFLGPAVSAGEAARNGSGYPLLTVARADLVVDSIPELGPLGECWVLVQQIDKS